MRIKIQCTLFLLTLVLTPPAVFAQTGGWKDADPAQGVAGVQVAAGEVVETFRLTAAYPNPFNPSTRFTLTVAKPQHVLVEVYNLLGRRVDVLHDGLLEADERYTFTFDADQLPSGLYLIRVAGEQSTSTQRVTLLK